MTAVALALAPRAPESWTLPGECRGCYQNHRDGTGYCDCDCHRVMDKGWRLAAACDGEDPGLFIGHDGEGISERRTREAVALEVCGGCPVTAQCLRFAARTKAYYGVFGGTGQVERREMRLDAYRRANGAEAA